VEPGSDFDFRATITEAGAPTTATGWHELENEFHIAVCIFAMSEHAEVLVKLESVLYYLRNFG